MTSETVIRPILSSNGHIHRQNVTKMKINDMLDQAGIVRKQLKDLNLKVYTTIQPLFVSRKIERELNVKETKPPTVNQQCVFCSCQCDLCDAGYINDNPPPLPNTTKTYTGRCLRTC